MSWSLPKMETKQTIKQCYKNNTVKMCDQMFFIPELKILPQGLTNPTA